MAEARVVKFCTRVGYVYVKLLALRWQNDP